jgi:phage terminase large subunit-like protein
MEAWANAATDEITDEFVKDAECYIGLDLASKVDMAAAVKVFRKLIDGKMHYYIVPRLYLPKDRVQDPTKQHYQMFMHNGYLTVTDGAEIDFQTILADLLEDAKKYNVKMLCFDPDNATDITQQFESLTNVQRIEVPQTVRYMSEPMKLLESGVANKTIHHNNNLAMNWMMSNVIARLDFNDNIKPNKQRPENKIDGPVAAINALSQAFTNQVPEVKKTMTYQRAIFI